MKNILYIFVLLLSSWCCYSQAIQLTIHNKTGFDVDSGRIGEKYIGRIKQDSTIKINEIKELYLSNGSPFGLSNGIIKGKQKEKSIYMCRPKTSKITEGNFEYDINLQESSYGYKLFYRLVN